MAKILVVEEDKLLAELERDYLETNGFDVDIAQNGTDGYRRLLKGGYDGAILEVKAHFIERTEGKMDMVEMTNNLNCGCNAIRDTTVNMYIDFYGREELSSNI